MPVLVIDYGMGNLGSVKRSLEECGANVLVSGDPDDLDEAEKIILPGVGAFACGMRNLQSKGWVEPTRHAVLNEKVPLLGICLGMQLLATVGQEGEKREGLGIIPGEVIPLLPDSPQVRIPHVGWNEVFPTECGNIFRGIPDGSDFYFVHSFHFKVDDQKNVLAVTPYCGQIVSAVQSGLAFGVQFHPEKSSRLGFRLLKNFLEI